MIEAIAGMICVALNVYWEARDQSTAGQVAVAQVVLNRVEDPSYPDNACKVVYEGGEALNGCQFSWYCDGKTDIPPNDRAWIQAVLIASAVYSGSGHADMKGVTHYHAIYVKPYWSNVLRLVARIDDHVFYVEEEI